MSLTSYSYQIWTQKINKERKENWYIYKDRTWIHSRPKCILLKAFGKDLEDKQIWWVVKEKKGGEYHHQVLFPSHLREPVPQTWAFARVELPLLGPVFFYLGSFFPYLFVGAGWALRPTFSEITHSNFKTLIINALKAITMSFLKLRGCLVRYFK